MQCERNTFGELQEEAESLNPDELWNTTKDAVQKAADNNITEKSVKKRASTQALEVFEAIPFAELKSLQRRLLRMRWAKWKTF